MEDFRNIYEQQAHNKHVTLALMVCFILFLGFLGFGFDAFYLGTIDSEFFLPIGTVIALGFGSFSAVWSLKGGSSAVLRSTNAVPADPNNPAQKQLLNIVEEMSIAAGLPRPQVFIVPDSDPNAFATGKDPQNSAIAVTQGLLDTLNRDELQGVIAHEMSHIRNYDVRLMTVIAAMIGAILLLSDWARRGMFWGGGRRRSRSSGGSAGGAIALILIVLWLVGVILAPLISQIMAMAVSRKREYFADASGAELTRNPLALASALQKLEDASAPTESIKHGAAHLCIVDPLGRKMNAKEGRAADLFASHPPISKRIMWLKAMSYEIKPAV
ncbi:MAG TPA: M48 family metallopeptidase [Candidatus Acidoferrales bacterium]|nr:M48 family metallopeptidase [Candidatus Acidoferrales bacterium]